MNQFHCRFQRAGFEFLVPGQWVYKLQNHTPSLNYPDNHAAVAGATLYNGALLPVIDLAKLFHWPTTPASSALHVALLKLEHQMYGILCDGMGELMPMEEFASHGTRPLPPQALHVNATQHQPTGLTFAQLDPQLLLDEHALPHFKLSPNTARFERQTDADWKTFLLIRAGGLCMAISANLALSSHTTLEIVPHGLRDRVFLGFSNLRGQRTPVFDLASSLGMDDAAAGPAKEAIELRLGEGTGLMMCDAVLDVLTLDQSLFVKSQFRSAPFNQSSHWAFEHDKHGLVIVLQDELPDRLGHLTTMTQHSWGHATEDEKLAQPLSQSLESASQRQHDYTVEYLLFEHQCGAVAIPATWVLEIMPGTGAQVLCASAQGIHSIRWRTFAIELLELNSQLDLVPYRRGGCQPPAVLIVEQNDQPLALAVAGLKGLVKGKAACNHSASHTCTYETRSSTLVKMWCDEREVFVQTLVELQLEALA